MPNHLNAHPQPRGWEHSVGVKLLCWCPWCLGTTWVPLYQLQMKIPIYVPPPLPNDMRSDDPRRWGVQPNTILHRHNNVERVLPVELWLCQNFTGILPNMIEWCNIYLDATTLCLQLCLFSLYIQTHIFGGAKASPTHTIARGSSVPQASAAPLCFSSLYFLLTLFCFLCIAKFIVLDSRWNLIKTCGI